MLYLILIFFRFAWWNVHIWGKDSKRHPISEWEIETKGWSGISSHRWWSCWPNCPSWRTSLWRNPAWSQSYLIINTFSIIFVCSSIRVQILREKCIYSYDYYFTVYSWFTTWNKSTVVENQRKSLIQRIQHCERSELRLHFEWTKVNQKCQKLSILASFWKPEACSQTV